MWFERRRTNLKEQPRPRTGGFARSGALAAGLLAMALAVAGCGHSSGTALDTAAPPTGNDAPASVACPPARPSVDVPLPAGFPSPAGVRYTNLGPSRASRTVYAISGNDIASLITSYIDELHQSSYRTKTTGPANRRAEIDFTSSSVKGTVAIAPGCGDRLDLTISFERAS